MCLPSVLLLQKCQLLHPLWTFCPSAPRRLGRVDISQCPRSLLGKRRSVEVDRGAARADTCARPITLCVQVEIVALAAALAPLYCISTACSDGLTSRLYLSPATCDRSMHAADDIANTLHCMRLLTIFYDNILRMQKKTVMQVEGLRPGREYMLRVRACNCRGQGPWSRTASAETLPAPPDAPPAPAVGQRTACSLRLRWDAPAEVNGAAVVHYRSVSVFPWPLDDAPP